MSTTINAPGFSNTGLFGINDAGVMVGQVYNTDPLASQGVQISPVPEPSTGIFVGTVLAGLAILYWRRPRRN